MNYIIENDGTVTTERDVKGFTIDPAVGTGSALVMTATGWQHASDVAGFVRAEAARLAKMEPQEPEFV